jgi:hypothetical protein
MIVFKEIKVVSSGTVTYEGLWRSLLLVARHYGRWNAVW